MMSDADAGGAVAVAGAQGIAVEFAAEGAIAWERRPSRGPITRAGEDFAGVRSKRLLVAAVRDLEADEAHARAFQLDTRAPLR